MGVQDICHFLPAVPNPEAYFSAFDVFALTSREEPISVAMLEAASSGLPVVSFAGAGGGPELVENDAGIIVPYLDVPAMAKACVELCLNGDRRRRLGDNARAKVQSRYTLALQGPKLLRVIDEARGNARSGV
jgi:glycosyltransferase involved in cell wall biosynthesis